MVWQDRDTAGWAPAPGSGGAEAVTWAAWAGDQNEYAAIVHSYALTSDTVVIRNFNIRTAVFPYVGTVVTRFTSSGKADSGLADSPPRLSNLLFHGFLTPHVENRHNPHHGITPTM
jgi:hypothetical protein